MGFAISSLLADMVMNDLEVTCLNKLKFKPSLYLRYVDDVILCIPKDKIKHVLEVFNCYQQKLQFTIEIEKDKKIPFLDLQLIRDNNKIITDWYQKSTFSGRILNFLSNHP